GPAMWYIMQSIQSKYSLSERLIRTIAAIRSFPRDNVEDLIGRVRHRRLRSPPVTAWASQPHTPPLIPAVPQVNALDGYNRTALHYAAEKDETCVEILLEYGANPNALDGNKDTPLHWAAFKNNAECARALLDSGALVNARDYNDDTPLSWAAMKGNLESVSVLLDFGAEVRVVNLKGQSPMSRLVALLVRGLGTEREDSCFELLLRAVGHFELRKNGSMPWEVRRDQQLCEKLTGLCSAPGTLQSLCRYAVRRSLGVRFLPEAVEQLPLPTCLKEYVLLLS
ncbi:ASB8 protein, partial [Smithornis capensis]|nr:ASB8 protein [Smithornis capensis]